MSFGENHTVDLRVLAHKNLRVLRNVLPETSVAMYASGHVSLEDALSVILPGAEATVVKLHSASGATLKQVASRKKSLVDILAHASAADRLADMFALAKAATPRFVDGLIKDRLPCVVLEPGPWMDGIKGTKWQGWQAYFPMERAPPGTYSRFAECMAKCDDAFKQSGAKKTLHIRFNFKAGTDSVEINGKSIHLPKRTELVVTEAKDVVLVSPGDMRTGWPAYRSPPMHVVVKPDGSAIFAGKGRCLMEFLACWNDDAITTADVIGQACSSCFWCGREIWDPTSVHRHAGPVCASRYRHALQAFPRRSGPVTGVNVQPPPPRATVDVRVAGTLTTIPRSVMEASQFLKGMLEMQEDGAVEGGDDVALVMAQLHQQLAVCPQTLEDLDDMLTRPGWFPVETHRLEAVILAADCLDMEGLLTDALALYTDTFCTTPWEVYLPSDVTAAILRARETAGAPTPIRVPKRTMEFELHHEFIKAVEAGDIERMRGLVREQNADPNPPDTLTKAQRAVAYSKIKPTGWASETVPAPWMGCLDRPDVLDAALELGLRMEPYILQRSLFTEISCPDMYRVYIKHGATPADAPLEHALQHRSVALVEAIVDAAQVTALTPWQMGAALRRSSPEVMLMLLERGIVQPTREFVQSVLTQANHPAFVVPVVKAVCAALGTPPSKMDVELVLSRGPILLALLRDPAYADFLDADLLAQALRGNVPTSIFDLYTGPIEPRHVAATGRCRVFVKKLKEMGHAFTNEDIAQVLSVCAITKDYEVLQVLHTVEHFDPQRVVAIFSDDQHRRQNLLAYCLSACSPYVSRRLQLERVEEIGNVLLDGGVTLKDDDVRYYSSLKTSVHDVLFRRLLKRCKGF